MTCVITLFGVRLNVFSCVKIVCVYIFDLFYDVVRCVDCMIYFCDVCRLRAWWRFPVCILYVLFCDVCYDVVQYVDCMCYIVTSMMTLSGVFSCSWSAAGSTTTRSTARCWTISRSAASRFTTLSPSTPAHGRCSSGSVSKLKTFSVYLNISFRLPINRSIWYFRPHVFSKWRTGSIQIYRSGCLFSYWSAWYRYVSNRQNQTDVKL